MSNAFKKTPWPLSLVQRLWGKRDRPSDRLGISPTDPSHYRRWTEKLVKKSETASSLDKEAIFSGLMLAIANFSLENDASSTSDGARFEAGCYFFSAVDRLMNLKMPEKREEAMQFFLGQFVNASSTALSLSIVTIGKRLNSRMSLYGSQFRTGGTERDLVERLTDFVIFAERNQAPFEGDDAPISLTLDRTKYLVEIGIWSDCYLKAAAHILDNWKKFAIKPSMLGPKDPDLFRENMEDLAARLADHNRVEALISQTEDVANKLHQSLLGWLPLPNVSGMGPMNAVVREGWKENCTVYAFVLVSLAHFKANRRFFEKESFDPFLFNMANRISRLYENTLMLVGQHDKFDKKKATTRIATVLLKAKLAGDTFIEAISRESAEPDRVLLAFFADGIGLKGEPRDEFIGKLRVFTKCAMRDLSKNS